MKKIILVVTVFILFVVLFFGRVQIKEYITNVFKPVLPEPIVYQKEETEKPANVEIKEPEKAVVKEEIKSEPKTEEVIREINLAVPFTSQAPFANWDEFHEDACEEASVLMMDAFFDGRKLEAGSVDEELRKIADWELNKFGYFKDTTAEETAEILRGFYGHGRVEVKYDITEEDIRAVLIQKLPVIVPSFGRALGNPNFSGAGPLYHMLVVRGITKDGLFITNDPGTRNGEAYLYKASVLMNAVHDWNGGDVQNGRRAMIVVYP